MGMTRERHMEGEKMGQTQGKRHILLDRPGMIDHDATFLARASCLPVSALHPVKPVNDQ